MSRLQENLDLALNRFPDLAKELEFPDNITKTVLKIEIAKNGSPTAICKNGYLHSKYDPEKEARKTVESFGRRNNVCGVLEGLCLGYLAEAFIEAYPSSPLIILEPDKKLFMEILSVRNLRKIFEHPNLILLLANHPDSLYSVLPSFRDCNFIYMQNKALRELYKDYFTGIKSVFSKYLERRNINNNTLKKFGKLWVKNLFANFSAGKIKGGIDTLCGAFDNMPALLLAGGPSLDDHREKIKELSSRCLIICVDTASLFLKDLNISPDFIVTVDPQYYNSRHLDYFPDNKPLLVAESSTCPRSIRRHTGEVLIGASFFPLGKFLEKNLFIKKKLGAGGSVATAALDFAVFIGCKIVYIAGLDLGYIENRTHYKGNFLEYSFLSKSGRLNTPDSFNLRIMSNGDPILVKNNNGGPLKSDRRLNIYRWWFENHAQKNDNVSIFALDDRSSYIKGIGICSFENYPLPEIDKASFYKKISEKLSNFSIGASIKLEIKELSNEILKLGKLCEDALIIVDSLSSIEKSEYASSLQKLDQIDRYILSGKNNKMISFLIQSELIDIQSGDNQRDPIENSRILYKAIKDSSQYYFQLVKKYYPG